MIEITVKRLPGDRTGPPITDPLLTTEVAARARGEAEINSSHPARRKTVNINGPWMPYQRPGSMGRVQIGAATMVGMVRSFTREIMIEGNTFTADTRLTMEVLDAE